MLGLLAFLVSCISSCADYEWHCAYTGSWAGGTTTSSGPLFTAHGSPSTPEVAPRDRRDACFSLCRKRLEDLGRSTYDAAFGKEAEACTTGCERDAGFISRWCDRGRKVPSSFGAWK